MELAQMHQYLFILTTYVSAIMCTSWWEVGSKFPTALGTTLIKGYQCIDPDLCLPDIRSFIEHHITLVAKGSGRSFSCCAACSTTIGKNTIENVEALLESQFSPLAVSGRVLSKCGKCLRYMKHISTQPSRLYCM